MAGSLQGKRIVIAASRRIRELETIIEKQGGNPVPMPMQRTEFLADEVERELHRLSENPVDWMVLTTGMGLEALLDRAEAARMRSRIQERLAQCRVAARGYKTAAALQKLGIRPAVVDDDGTVQGLIRALDAHDLAGRTMSVQLHGEPVPKLTEYLKSRGAEVREWMPYRHLTSDEGLTRRLCEEIAESSVSAVCFTAAVQVRFLYRYAKEHGWAQQLTERFNSTVWAAAVGKVTAEALREEGVRRVVVPESERMGAMMVELKRVLETPVPGR